MPYLRVDGISNNILKKIVSFQRRMKFVQLVFKFDAQFNVWLRSQIKNLVLFLEFIYSSYLF